MGVGHPLDGPGAQEDDRQADEPGDHPEQSAPRQPDGERDEPGHEHEADDREGPTGGHDPVSRTARLSARYVSARGRGTASGRPWRPTFPRSPSTVHSTDSRVPSAVRPLSTEPNPTIFLIVGPQPDGRRPAHLGAFAGHGDRRALHERGDLRREAVPGVHRLDRGPVEVQADEAPCGAARLALGDQRPLARELGFLVERDEAPQPDLERRVLQLGRERVPGARVLGLDQDQARFEPADVERLDPGRPQPVVGADLEEPVPHRERALPRDPQLVAEVARVPGPGDVDVDALDRAGSTPEVAEVEPVLSRRALEDLAGQAPLQGERRGRLRDVVDPHVEAGRVQGEPSVRGVRGRDAEPLLIQTGHGPVVDHLAFLVAPGRVDHLVDGDAGDVPRDHPVQERRGVPAADLVLVEGRDVDHGGGLADRVVLDVHEVREHGGGVIARPIAPRELGVQLPLSLEEGRPDAHPRQG